jgi:hypothetical protein
MAARRVSHLLAGREPDVPPPAVVVVERGAAAVVVEGRRARRRRALATGPTVHRRFMVAAVRA